MRVARWGNSLAVRLPAVVVAQLALSEGDEITVTVVGKRSFEIIRDERRTDALDRMRQLRRPLPTGWNFDRAEANER